jgi:uncharacterized protein YutE (UPF0331/DUF86 family)
LSLAQQTHQLRSSLKILRSEERRIKQSIREQKAYYTEQQLAIQNMVDLGNNTIRMLVVESDEYIATIVEMKEDIIDLNAELIDKRYELAVLNKL